MSSLIDLFFSSCEIKFNKLTQVYLFSQCSIVPSVTFTVLEKLQRSMKNVKRKVSGTDVSNPNLFLSRWERLLDVLTQNWLQNAMPFIVIHWVLLEYYCGLTLVVWFWVMCYYGVNWFICVIIAGKGGWSKLLFNMNLL